METLSTARLLLRPFTYADADALMIVFGDPDVMRFGDGAQTQDWLQSWLRNVINQQYPLQGYGPLAVVLRETNRLIGYCGLFYFPDLAGQPEVELGYRLAKTSEEMDMPLKRLAPS